MIPEHIGYTSTWRLWDPDLGPAGSHAYYLVRAGIYREKLRGGGCIAHPPLRDEALTMARHYLRWVRAMRLQCAEIEGRLP